MSMATTQENSKFKKRRMTGIYGSMLITRKIVLSIVNVGNNIKQTLENVIAKQVEGRCVVEGFVKPLSSKILTYSSGTLKGANIEFEIVFECLVCCPVEGMHIACVAKNITKAGIRAETAEDPSPVVVFVARDHHLSSEYFTNVKEDDTINVRVIGQRYELNDKYISVIAELLEPREEKIKRKRKPKLIMKD
jgi:DNA-directed RNA polymerase subunit E'/Rpb7|tara:strand:+ start:3588 stop:4163 length:576 start_codon:yes stop_codon:yes gene_type:complete